MTDDMPLSYIKLIFFLWKLFDLHCMLWSYPFVRYIIDSYILVLQQHQRAKTEWHNFLFVFVELLVWSSLSTSNQIEQRSLKPSTIVYNTSQYLRLSVQINALPQKLDFFLPLYNIFLTWYFINTEIIFIIIQ